VLFLISFRKVAHIELIFGVPAGFVSRSVHARLQVTIHNGHNLCHPG